MSGRISKIGDAGVRTALYEAANVILTRTRKGSSLKKWAMGVASGPGCQGQGGAGTQAGGGAVSVKQVAARSS